MEKLVENFIRDINNIMGVKASYLINNRGEILFPNAEKPGRSFLNAAGALELLQTMGIFELAGEDIVEMEIDYMEGKLLVYNNLKLNYPTRLGVHETVLVVVGEKTFNKAHLRLALNVSLANVVTDRKYKKMDQPVKIRKNSTLTREKLPEKEYAMVEKVKSLIT